MAGSATGVDGGWKLATGVGTAVLSTVVFVLDATTDGSGAAVVGEGIGCCYAICGVRENMRITMPAEI